MKRRLSYYRRPSIIHVQADFARYLAKNAGGGSLHCVLMDGNNRDIDCAQAREMAASQGDHEGERLAVMLAQMSRTQRLRIAGAALRLPLA